MSNHTPSPGTEERKEFQTEIRQLLDLVVNSLYTNREIFLRELISNAADACEKVRYMALTSPTLRPASGDLGVEITINEQDHILTISDNGVGMTREELIENLGTIAHSGSKSFLSYLSEHQEQAPDLSLIGQFGVGFYSAFMVATKVVIQTLSADSQADACCWTSEGLGSYTLSAGTREERGTSIEIHLKEDAFDLGKADKIKQIINKYSNFVPYPVSVNGDKVNTVEAIWVKNKNEISGEEYDEFYKFYTGAYDDPLGRLHFSSDAPLSLHALLYMPGSNMERFGFSRIERGVNLFCKKVLIQEKSETILPEWMRFVRGVIDCEDLPLNISRETLQDSTLLQKLNRVVASRLLKYWEEQARDEKTTYEEFWKEFGIFLKEGAATDIVNRADLLKLLRFESSITEPGELTSLDEYVDRMTDSQKNIYFVSGPTRASIEQGPYLEIFRESHMEVLYTYQAIDDYVLMNVGSYRDKPLQSVDQDSGDLPDLGPEKSPQMDDTTATQLTTWLKEVFQDKVKDVRVSKRLVDSPAVLLSMGGSHSMNRLFQSMNEASGIGFPGNAFGDILEINANHDVIQGIERLRAAEDPFATTAAGQLLVSAQMAAGLHVDPRLLSAGLNDLLARAVQTPSHEAS
ncbi:MAG: molecular chaperone HtpG [Peptococcaceae bacterium]|nr:molecular chaperone HtpG [Peptococcaceae bacterium]